MSDNPLDKFDRKSEESSAKQYSVFDSVRNLPLIDRYDQENKRLSAENLELRQKLASKNQRESLLILIFSIASSISIAFGVNLVTGHVDQGWGVFLIILGVAFALCAWFLKVE